jgi:WD40 repeat protein
VVCPAKFRLLGHEGSIHRVVWGAVAAAAAGKSADQLTQAGGSGVCTCSICSSVCLCGSSSSNALQLLGSCSDDRTCRLWRVPLQQHQASAYPSSHDPAATLAAAAAAHQGMGSDASTAQCCAAPVVLKPFVILWGHTARVWDVALLQVQQQQQQQQQTLSQAAVAGCAGGRSSSSRSNSSWLLVATGSEDCSVRLWNGATGRVLAVLQVRLLLG